MTQHSAFNTKGQIQKIYLSLAVAITLILLSLPGLPVIDAALSSHNISWQPFRFLVSKPRGPFQFELEPARGRFLVASQNLRDPNFLETVVLLIKYDRSGTMGLVINRPTSVKLSEILPNIRGMQQIKETVYLGGPVERHQIQLLIQSDSQPDGSHNVFKNIYVSASQEVLERMIDNPGTGERFRVYAGFAGWIPGQLEREISRGSWHVLSADAEILFDRVPSDIWPELIRRSSFKYVAL